MGEGWIDRLMYVCIYFECCKLNVKSVCWLCYNVKVYWISLTTQNHDQMYNIIQIYLYKTI